MGPVAEEQNAMLSFTSKKARTFRLKAALEVSFVATCWQLSVTRGCSSSVVVLSSEK
ncbi:hypothetical protein D3C81_1893970 [compost metagenome]